MPLALLLPQVFFVLDPLPPLAQPAHVTRRRDKTLLWVDPRALRTDLCLFMIENLTDAERQAYRRAFGLPDLGLPLPDGFLDGDASSLTVPECLHLRPMVRQDSA